MYSKSCSLTYSVDEVEGKFTIHWAVSAAVRFDLSEGGYLVAVKITAQNIYE